MCVEGGGGERESRQNEITPSKINTPQVQRFIGKVNNVNKSCEGVVQPNKPAWAHSWVLNGTHIERLFLAPSLSTGPALTPLWPSL